MTAKKVFSVFGIAFLIFLIAIPLFSYKAFKSAIKEKSFNHLITARELLHNQVKNYFHERFSDTDVLASNPITTQGLSRLSMSFRTSGFGSPEYLESVDIYQSLMQHYVTDYGYVNIFFVDRDGDVVYSVKEDEYTGTNLLTGKYKYFSMAQAFKRGLEEVTFEDYTWHDDQHGFTSCFAAPIRGNQAVLGVLIIEIPFSHLDAMLTRRAGLGQTGEIYLVGEDGFMRSNSRFSEEPTILQKEVDTKATRDAFDGNTGTKIVNDYRGVSVLSAYTPLDLKFVDWILLAEIDEEEAFSVIRSVEATLIIVASVIGVIAIAYLYLVKKREDRYEVLEHVEETES
ncbi:MAG: cache domain-containing protein [Planctomycetota bacterium]|jgi:methyl-accepting chemotaxis protein